MCFRWKLVAKDRIADICLKRYCGAANEVMGIVGWDRRLVEKLLFEKDSLVVWGEKLTVSKTLADFIAAEATRVTLIRYFYIYLAYLSTQHGCI